jgi:2-aminoadipate transaminase
MNWTKQFARRTAHMKRTAVREILKLTAQPDMISFAGGLPAPELFPVAEIERASASVLRTIGSRSLQYGETEGVGELRDWIACGFGRPGAQVERNNVVIVSGGQQGLDLLGRVLLDEGDRVVVENPTYLALLSAWRPSGAEFLPVAADHDGMRVDELEPLFRQGPKALYALPNFQNPQGTTLSAERRVKLVELARAHGVGLVEDDPYGELRYDGEPLPHLFHLDAGHGPTDKLAGNVVFVGTFSKVLVPGLRLGWVIGPEELIDKVVQAKQAADLHTSTFNQYLVLTLLREGLLEKRLPQLRAAYRARRDAMLAGLERHFPPEVKWTRPAGGMFLMVTLPNELNAMTLLQDALQHKVAFVPGEEFHLHGAGRNTFRLNFSNSPPALIEEGIVRLGSLLKKTLAGRLH